MSNKQRAKATKELKWLKLQKANRQETDHGDTGEKTNDPPRTTTEQRDTGTTHQGKRWWNTEPR